MITADNIILHEFIGMNTLVVNSTNAQIIGINGTIVDETKSMFTLDTKKGFKKIAKNNSDWEFVVNSDKIVVKGSKINKRPQDRLEIKQ